MQEKHYNTVPDLKSAKLQQEDGTFMLSLDCVYYTDSIFVRREICSKDPVPAKVFADT